ncbi:MAG: hypothetical protein OEV06_10180, partial [Anaerolineae bacterium]|nr:hypothetical protein [Anaerolineae bacterium]
MSEDIQKPGEPAEPSGEDPRKKFKRLTDENESESAPEESQDPETASRPDSPTGVYSTREIGMAGWFDGGQTEEEHDEMSATEAEDNE